MAEMTKETSSEIKYEVNLKFITQVRDTLDRNPLSRNIPIMPRNEDSSVYTASDEEPVLLSFSV
jgi:hypothetical protein